MYSLPAGYKAVADTTILTSQHNPPLEDIAAALTGSLPRDGSAAMTGPLKLQAGAPTLPNEAVRKDYVDKKWPVFWGGTSTGTANAQVVTTAQTNFSLTAGSSISFNPGFTNTDAATLAIDGGAATAIKKLSPFGLLPLTGKEIIASQIADIVYDGTQFVLLNDARGEGRPEVITANTAFTTSDLGSLIEFTAVTTVTATIPAAPQVGSFLIWNHSSVVQNVAAAAGSIYEPTGVAVSPLVLRPGEVVTLISDGSLWFIGGRYPAIRVTVPKRQTVLSGPADANGLPTFFPATSVNLTLTMQNVAGGTPLVATIANGFDNAGQFDLGVRVTTNLAVTVSASTTSYIYLDDTGALGATTLAPIYQFSGAASVTNGQHTYIIGQGQMYVGNGTTAAAINRVFIGEAVASGTAITATVAYAYQGYYDSGWTNTLPGTGANIIKNSNLGIADAEVDFMIQNITAEFGYSVGDTINYVTVSAATNTTYAMLVGFSRNTVWFTTGTISSIAIYSKNTGAGASPTAARWAYRLTARRPW